MFDNIQDIYHYDNFLSLVHLGYKKIFDKNIVVCSCIRNIEGKIDSLLSTLLVLNRCCNKLTVLFYENDSTDNTIAIVNNWINNNKDIDCHLYSKNLNTQNLGSVISYERLKNLSDARNELFNIVKKDYNSYDYMIVADGDIKRFDISGIISSFSYDDWDMMGANGIDIIDVYNTKVPIYYDILPLMKMNMDCPYQRGHKLIPPYEGLIRVKSAFGGLAIYRICDDLLKCQYDVNKFVFYDVPSSKNDIVVKNIPLTYVAYKDGDDIYGCDHMGLCMNMLENGLDKIYINTNMVLMRT